MNQNTTTCSDDRLLSLLHSDEESEEARILAVHVDQCSRCQHRLEALAAEPVEWRIVKESLLDGTGESHVDCESKETGSAPRNFNVEDGGRRPWCRPRWHRHPQAWTNSMARQILAPPSHPEMLGRIGRYEVERLIGVGGMGVVFKAFDTELNRPVAVKVLAPYLAGSGAARQRFAREARAAAAVVHEHVVAIHNVETDGESPFLVMPYVAGESLQQRIDRDGALELCEVLRIATQTASGLAAAHAQGLVHRDVKPSNILLEQGIERTLLTDFGLARASDDASLTHTGYHPGTPQYMSPEQARGDAVDARSDLFSLGSVIYTMCTGRPPFRAETNYGVLRRITDNEPRLIREVNPVIPEWLEGIVNKLLAKDVSQRFQSAHEVAELLEQCLAYVQQPTAVVLPTACREFLSKVDKSKSVGIWSQLKNRCSASSRGFQVAACVGGVLLLLTAVGLAWSTFSATSGQLDEKQTNSPSLATSGISSPSEADAWDGAASDLDLFSQELAPFETRSQQLWDTSPAMHTDKE